MSSSWFDQSPYRNNHPYTRYSRISVEDAMSIAQEQISGEVVKVKLDTENGVQIFEVDIINTEGVKYEVEIDAETGVILKIEKD